MEEYLLRRENGTQFAAILHAQPLAQLLNIMVTTLPVLF